MFRSVVTRHHASLVRVARPYVSSIAVAEEVAQETWIAAISGLDQFQGRSSFQTWLYRILLNTARRRGARDARTTPVANLDDGASVDASRFHRQGHPDERHWRVAPSDWTRLPGRVIESRDTRLAIGDAIDQLPTRQREVIMLSDVHGLTAVEVCELLGLSEGNQRVLLHRARSKVRASLESRFEGAPRD